MPLDLLPQPRAEGFEMIDLTRRLRRFPGSGRLHRVAESCRRLFLSWSLVLGSVLLNSNALPARDGPAEPVGSVLASEVCKVGPEGAASSLRGGCLELGGLVARAREAIAEAKSPAETLDRLNRFFFHTESFQVTYDLSSSDHLLPGPVLAGRRGYCVGLAAVYLILAEELGLPIHAVATPKHVFLRWDD